jgi:hypothetical protein
MSPNTLNLRGDIAELLYLVYIDANERSADCLVWVKSGHGDNATGCPLYPQQRILAAVFRMSALGHKQTSRQPFQAGG